MNVDEIDDVEIPEEVSEVPTEQLEEWDTLVSEVKGTYHKRRNYYKKTVRSADSDKRVKQAEKALDRKLKAGEVKRKIGDELKKRRVEIDDRDRVRASYVDDSGTLTFIDPERKLKVQIDVEAIEYRISESLGREVMADELHGKDVHVESEVLAPDRVLIVASDGSRKAQIEVTGTVTTHVEK